MSLRRQLLVIGLITLVLPWSVIQAIKGMDTQLRAWQGQRVITTLRTLEARIIENRDLLVGLDRVSQRIQTAQYNWFAPLLDVEPVVDGYIDDWLPRYPQKQQCAGRSETFEMECLIGRSRDFLYLALKIHDDQRQYHNPMKPLAVSDHVYIRAEGKQARRDLIIYSSAPGAAKVVRLGDHGDYSPEYAAQAVWREQGDAYLIEVKIPLYWLRNGFDVLVNGLSLTPLESAVNLIAQDYELSHELARFAEQDTQFFVIVNNRWVLASAGTLELSRQRGLTWQEWLMRLIIGKRDLPSWQFQIQQGELIEPFENDDKAVTTQWFRSDKRAVIEGVMPLDGYHEAGIYMVMHQSSTVVDRLLGGAMGRALLYAGLAGIFVTMVIMGYATWISLRIRRLSHEVAQSVDNQGRIGRALTVSRSADEIGSLSRSFVLMVQRLEGYTRYLERLSQQLSHELRTPIAIVRSSLDNLTYTSGEVEASRLYIERASEGLQRLSSILNAMSSASHIQQSLQDAELSTIDLRELIAELAQAYQSVYANNKILFSVHGQGQYHVAGNSELIAQLLDKLLQNAVEFSADDTPVEIRLSSQPDSVEVAVRNTGEPIPEELLKSIFDPLVSSRNQEPDTQHMGLGLYVVKLIAQYHQASVLAENVTKLGQVQFSVCFPHSAMDGLP